MKSRLHLNHRRLTISKVGFPRQLKSRAHNHRFSFAPLFSLNNGAVEALRCWR